MRIMRPNKKAKYIGIRVNKRLENALRKSAQEKDVSMSWLVRRILAEHFLEQGNRS